MFRLGGWNFYTVKFTSDLISNSSTIEIYVNFKIKIQHTYTSFSFKIEKMWILNDDSVAATYNTMHEAWWHIGMTSIDDLKPLFASASSCGCSYGCTTSPSILCLPNFTFDKNSDGNLCPNECRSLTLSCDTDNNCIYNQKESCFYGIYVIETRECLFYCPENSCKCSTNPYICSCIEGYNKISDSPLACISNLCLEYHSEGYKFICDVLKQGYVLNSLGECCTCDEDYMSITSNPIVCTKKISHCLSYIQNIDEYVCIACSEGYTMDDLGACNMCSQEYQIISSDPFICAEGVNNCLKYELDGEKWRCEECLEGYEISNLYECDRCEEGYVQIGEEELVCKTEILKCIEYVAKSVESKCLLCEIGYRVDRNYECSLCEAGYVGIYEREISCAREISRCKDYMYDERLYEWICQECNTGYKVDDSQKCNQCDQGYTSVSTEVLECALESESIPKDQNQSDLNESQTSSDEVVSQLQIERGETIQEASAYITTSTSASTSVSGIVSMDPSVLILYINTVKLLSFITHLNIPLTYEIRKEQSSTQQYIQYINPLSYLSYQDQELDKYLTTYLDDPYSFISNIIYELMILVLIAIFNIIIYLLSRYTRGKLKKLTSKALSYFRYNAYIQFFMLSYVELTYSALSKLIHVILTQPKETYILNILDYVLALLFMVIHYLDLLQFIY